MHPVAKILSLSFTLFLLMDSLGNIPLFMAILKNLHPKRQRQIIRRELIIALGVIILFALIGDAFLSFLNVHQYTVQIAGGIILFLIALKMIFPQHDAPNEKSDKEPFIVPLAIPLVAGPAALAAVMLYSKEEPLLLTIASICIAWIFTAIVLMGSQPLQRLLGQRGLTACERLMGLILTLLAVQMFLEGISSYIDVSCLSRIH